ncbi:DUF2752 domain-containing protein [bacterium]|nr:DUF2752 domain-containing protein [bacterium]
MMQKLPKAEALRASIVVFSITLAFLALWFVDPQKSIWLPRCVFHDMTGLYCPGCGMLRSLHQLVHGNLQGAVAFNILIVFAVPVIAWSIVVELLELLKVKLPCKRFRSVGIYWISSAVIVVFGILRNIQFYPLTLLRPH